MVRSVGIDAGEYAVKTVEIDGGYRKTRLLGYRIEKVTGAVMETDARAAAAATAVAEALRAAKMSGDKVLGYPCREAVLRTIEVPFRGADAIRKVIKSEVESAIHSHQVDDMVVDFHELGGSPEGSRVLVAAVPKPGLRSILTALTGEGVEPERVDLDTMALYRVAEWCGAFRAPGLDDEIALEDDDGADVAVPAVVAATAPAGSGSITAVLDLGARSTRVLLVDGGRLVDMRTLRLGDATIVDAVARGSELPFDTAREAVRGVLESGADYQTEIAAALPVAAEGAEAEPAPVPASRKVVVDAAAVDAERATYLQRLARELTRFLASSNCAGRIDALWITGGASQLSGLEDTLREVFGTSPHQLDVLGHVKHSLSAEEADEVAPQLAVALGLALANLGGPLGYDFRREDLAFTRGFDRVKSALAITCMLMLFTAIVYGVRQTHELKNLEYRIGLAYQGPDADPKKPRLFGMLGPIVRSDFVSNERYFKIEEGSKKDYAYRDLMQDLLALPVPDRIKFVRDKLRRALDLKQKESGIYEEVALESGLAVLVRFFEVLQKAEGSLGKYMLATLELNMTSTPGSGHSGRWLQCRFAIRGDGFRERYSALRSAIEEECQRPGSPFEAIDDTRGGGDQ